MADGKGERVLILRQVVGEVGVGVSVPEAEALVEVDGGAVAAPSGDFDGGGAALCQLLQGGGEENTAVSFPLPFRHDTNRLNLAYRVIQPQPGEADGK